MKQIIKQGIIFLLAAPFALSLAACGGNKTSDSAKPDSPTAKQPKATEQEESSTHVSDDTASADSSIEGSGDTVANAVADPKNQQTLFLWEEGNMPAITEYTQNNGSYADEPDFRPYVVTFPVPEGTKVKGAVLINAGGAFQFRSDQTEGTPVAQELSKLGYQSFVVNYRLRPYTQEEGALDLAQAVRFVRKHAGIYGIEEKDIAVMGFSAGGIYSFYGRLSVASTDVEKFASSKLPPTYFCYGTRDPFVGEFEECIEALREAGVTVDVDVLDGRPHGYGYTEGWISAYDEWLTQVFENN